MGSLTSLQRCSRRIFQLQPTGMTLLRRLSFHLPTLVPSLNTSKYIGIPPPTIQKFILKTPPYHTPTHNQKLQILETLYRKMNKPSLNKINFECSSRAQECLKYYPQQFFLLPPGKFFFCKFPSYLFFLRLFR